MKKYFAILVMASVCHLCIAQQSGPGFVNGQYRPEYHNNTYTPPKDKPLAPSPPPADNSNYHSSPSDNAPVHKSESKPVPENGFAEYTYPDGTKYTGNYKKSKRSGTGTGINPYNQKYEGEWADDKYNGKGTWSMVGYQNSYQQYIGDFVNGERKGHGICTRSGYKYDGEWNKFEEGFGTATYNDADTYTGMFVAGHQSGQGTLTKANGDKYTGTWLEGSLSAGTIVFATGEKYTGHLKWLKMDGEGTLYNAAGKVKQQGYWDMDLYMGQQPAHQLADGSKYYGQWKDDMMDGQGTFVSGSETYSGSFKNNHRNGYGKLTYTTDAYSYEGEWKDDKKDGQGKNTTKEDSYSGTFKNDRRQGYGKLTSITGGGYEGNFEGGEKSGTGTGTTAKGDKYTGQWLYGKENGAGTYIYADGTKFDGNWKDGIREGTGTLYDATGKVKQQGKWKAGVFVDPNNPVAAELKKILQSATNKFKDAKGNSVKKATQQGEPFKAFSCLLLIKGGDASAQVVTNEIREYKEGIIFYEELAFKDKAGREDFNQQLYTNLPPGYFSTVWGVGYHNFTDYPHVTLKFNGYDNKETIEVEWRKEPRKE